MTTANVYQQRPTTGEKAESPLFHADLNKLVGKGRANPGVLLREKKLLGHLTIRGDAHDPAFTAGMATATGMELPKALTVAINGESSLQWLGPDEWLLIVPSGEEFEAEQKLRAALTDLVKLPDVGDAPEMVGILQPHDDGAFAVALRAH